MNKCVLRGIIRNIEFSHQIGDVEFDKASIVTKDGDIVDIKFKKFSNKYKDGDYVELSGNARSYSHKTADGRNRVELYVFTYFDVPESEITNEDQCNVLELSGRICKMDNLHTNNNGKQSVHFIIANNLEVGTDGRQLNSYIPCICFGTLAKQISEKKVNDPICCTGFLHSREYKKPNGDGGFDIKVAHEYCVNDIIE